MDSHVGYFTIALPHTPLQIRTHVRALPQVRWATPDWSGGFPLVHYTLTLQRWEGSGDNYSPVTLAPSGLTRATVAVSATDAAARPGIRKRSWLHLRNTLLAAPSHAHCVCFRSSSDAVAAHIFRVSGLRGGEYRFGLQAVNSAGIV